MFQRKYSYKAPTYANIHGLSDGAKKVLRELTIEIHEEQRQRLLTTDIVELAETFQAKAYRLGYNFRIEDCALAFVDRDTVFEVFGDQLKSIFRKGKV